VAKNFCHMLGGGKQVLSETINPVGAKTGDMVKIGIPDGAVTKASLIVYMVPAIGFVGGASLGYCIAKLYSLDLNILTFIGSIFGFGLSMISVRFLNNALSKRSYYQPEITKIIHPDNLECED
jgi:positive regulator of sigma E activity